MSELSNHYSESESGLSKKASNEETKNLIGNLKTRFKTYMEEFLTSKSCSSEERHKIKLLQMKLGKTTNISTIREVLYHQPLRIYLKKIFLSGRLVRDIINSDISDFSKAICFKYLNILINGFDRPDNFRSWKVQYLRCPRRNRNIYTNKQTKEYEKDTEKSADEREFPSSQKSETDSKQPKSVGQITNTVPETSMEEEEFYQQVQADMEDYLLSDSVYQYIRH